MTLRFGRMTAAAALAAVLALSTPVSVYAESILTGTADLPEENMILTGTRDLPEDAAGFSLDPDAMLMGISDAPEDVVQALADVVGYLQGMSGDLTVGTEGGEWSIIALARNGALSDSARETYVKNLMAALDQTRGVLSKAKYTEYSRVVLALGALGMDPRSVGGYDLVQPLSNFTKICIQGINGPIWALIALDSVNYEVPALAPGEKGEQTSREGIIRYLLDSQQPGGGWSFSGNGLDDMNMMAVQALTPYYHERADVKEAVDRAISAWSVLQNDRGGFGDSGDDGSGGVEATCQTIIALSGLDVSLIDSEMFTKNGSTLLNALLQYQAPDGSFRHTLNGNPGNAIATDQAALALTAYLRALNGQTRVYDMTDVGQQGAGPATAEEVEALRAELYAIPMEPDMDDLEAISSLQARLAQMGSFPEKEEFTAQLASLREYIAPQEAEIRAWDEAMTKIVPAKLTLKDKKAVEDLRRLYNALPHANRKYLQYAGDLLMLEEKLLQLDNEGFPILGEAKGPEAAPQSGQSGGVRKPSGGTAVTTTVTTTVESNTLDARVRDGRVDREELDRIRGQDKNLRMEARLDNGMDYALTLHGTDFDTSEDVDISIDLQSKFAEEIGILSENPYIFRLNQQGYFPGPVQVELPVELEDGLYMLLRYNEAERKAEYVMKTEVKDGRAVFVLERGGDYFITGKAIKKSIDELEAAETTPPPETTVPSGTTAPAETQPVPAVTEETGSSFNGWIAAGIGAAVVAVLAAAVLVLLNRRKADK